MVRNEIITIPHHTKGKHGESAINSDGIQYSIFHSVNTFRLLTNTTPEFYAVGHNLGCQEVWPDPPSEQC